MWTVLKGRVLMVENLNRRNMMLINRCTLCKSTEESVRHLFNDCAFSQLVWRFFGISFGVNFLSEPDIDGKLKVKPSTALSHIGKLYWETCIHAISWAIWMERNNRIFEESQKNIHQLIDEVKLLIWDWNILHREGKKVKREEAIFNRDNILRP